MAGQRTTDSPIRRTTADHAMPQKQKKNKKKKYQNRAGGTREAHPPTGPLQRPHSESAAASMALKSRNPQGYFTADMNQVTAL